MPIVKGSYVGNTVSPQFRNYPTAGLLKPTPLPSVTPATKPSNAGGFAGVSPVNPDILNPQTQPPIFQPPPVGPSAPTVPAFNDGMPGGQAPATPRDQLVNAIMKGGKGRIDQ